MSSREYFFLIAGIVIWFLVGWVGHTRYIEWRYPAIWAPAGLVISKDGIVCTESIEYRVKFTPEER